MIEVDEGESVDFYICAGATPDDISLVVDAEFGILDDDLTTDHNEPVDAITDMTDEAKYYLESNTTTILPNRVLSSYIRFNAEVHNEARDHEFSLDFYIEGGYGIMRNTITISVDPQPTPTPTPTPTATPTNGTPTTGTPTNGTPTTGTPTTGTPTPTATPTPEPIAGDTSAETRSARITSIEGAFSEVVVSPNDRVLLSVSVYGPQNVKDNSLADNVVLDWEAVGDGSVPADAPGNRSILYTAPSTPGTYRVKVEVPSGDCSGNACDTSFTITVVRSSPPREPTPEPRNPDYDIPAAITDGSGNQCAVMTPEDGGRFEGDDYSIAVPSSAVHNDEIIGVCMDNIGAANETAIANQNYTLVGSLYEVSAVDASGAALTSYRLNRSAEICLPLPSEQMVNFTEQGMVAISQNGSVVNLATVVRFGASSLEICGNLSTLPVSVAVGSLSAQGQLPSPTVTAEPEAPNTGAAAPSSTGALVWLLLLGIATFALAAFLLSANGRSSPSG